MVHLYGARLFAEGRRFNSDPSADLSPLGYGFPAGSALGPVDEGPSLKVSMNYKDARFESAKRLQGDAGLCAFIEFRARRPRLRTRFRA
jgi:hypothetical protein